MTDTGAKRNFDLLDDLRYARIGTARLSPDGKSAVCEAVQHDLENDITFTSLWLIDIAGGEARQLTFDKGNNSAPAWSPDGDSIAFLSDRSGKRQIYLLPVAGGEARQFTHLPQGVDSQPQWSPDGTMIAFTAGALTKPRDPAAPYRVTRTIYRFDGIGYLDEAVQNIYVQSIAGGEPQQLTDDAHLDRALRWSPDGRELLYLAAHDPDRADLFSPKIRAVNLDGEIDEILGLDWGFVKAADWTADGGRIIVIASSGDQPMATKDNLWLMDRAGTNFENRSEDFPLGVDIQWFPAFSTGKLLKSGSSAWVNVVNRGSKETWSIALTGEPAWQKLLSGERSMTLCDADDAQLLFLNSDLTNPGELHTAALDGSNERPITSFNAALMDEIAFPKVEHLLYQTEDGVEIQGWLLIPNGGEPPYPTILYIHGGPHWWYGNTYGTDFQMLAGAGYAVLFVNPRGSTGYGDDFATVLSRQWGVLDHKDILAGVDHVIDRGFADPDRLGVFGLSYGGYMTTFLIGHTHRFKAAVAENPVIDLVSEYGTADMCIWGAQSLYGGKPHEAPDVYRRSSPITYAHLVKTPTLLIQCEDDFRCPIGQGEQFYAHLKANGCHVEMLRIPGMSHTATIDGPIYVQKAQNEALVEWMDRYVK